jgi:hypothetical protein
LHSISIPKAPDYESIRKGVALYNIFIKYLLLLRWEIQKFAFLDELDQAEIELVSRKIAL